MVKAPTLLISTLWPFVQRNSQSLLCSLREFFPTCFGANYRGLWQLWVTFVFIAFSRMLVIGYPIAYEHIELLANAIFYAKKISQDGKCDEIGSRNPARLTLNEFAMNDRKDQRREIQLTNFHILPIDGCICNSFPFNCPLSLHLTLK